MFHARFALLALIACGAPEGTPTATAAAPVSTLGMPDVVAEVNGKPITFDELMQFGGAEIVQAEIALHEARSGGLDQLISQGLLEAEAEKHGMTVDVWLKQEIDAKLTPPTDAEIDAFFQENQRSIRGSLEEVRPQLTQYLQQEQGTKLFKTLLDGLEAEAGVVRHLPPYRVEVTSREGPLWGDVNAPIQIIEFSDFQCPYCTQGAETVRQVKEKYGDKVAVSFRHFPLPMHSEAPRASEAAECAHEQGKFWEFHDALFEDQKPWNDEDLSAIAKTVGAKPKKFDECLASGRHAATVEADLTHGRAAGMGGTPGYYVNGRVLTGAQPIEAFVTVIDEELARTGG